jgi:ribose transport system substrate-binding protein
MRRHLATGLAVVAAAALTACGGGGTSASKPHYKIVVIEGTTTDDYYISLARGAQQAAKALGNVTVTATGPQQFAPAQQIPVLESVIATKPDAIVIAPDDPAALQAPLQSAVSQGIKVVLVDTTLNDPSIAVSQVTSDNVQAGEDAANYLAKQIGGKGAVFVQDVAPGVTTTDARAQGFRMAMKNYPNITDLGIQYDTADSAQQATSQTSAMLSAHPNIAGVFALNTFTGAGVATAVKQAGKAGTIKVVGFDAEPTGVTALKTNAAQAEVVLEPVVEGYQSIVQAVNALEGKPVKKKILTGAIIATTANLDSDQVQKYLYTP